MQTGELQQQCRVDIEQIKATLKLRYVRGKITDMNCWDDVLPISKALQFCCIVPARLDTIRQLSCL